MPQTIRITTLGAALAVVCSTCACHSARSIPRGAVVLRSEHLVVRSLPPALESDDENVLPLLHVSCTPDERFLALHVVIWDDVDGDGRRSAFEASERWDLEARGERHDVMEWRGLRLPPGGSLLAELDATLERHGRFQGTWRVSPQAP
jgi:hypothetical protein